MTVRVKCRFMHVHSLESTTLSAGCVEGNGFMMSVIKLCSLLRLIQFYVLTHKTVGT